MSKNDIPLTEDGGLDPRLTFCGRCKCDTNEIIVGDNRLMKNENTGQVALAPRDRIRQTAKQLGWTQHDYTVEMVPEGKLPASSLCDSCSAELAKFADIVKAGGIYWRCLECHANGVYPKSEYTAIVRESNGIGAPEPTGVEFTACAAHDDPITGEAALGASE